MADESTFVQKALHHFSLSGYLASTIQNYKSETKRAEVTALARQHSLIGRRYSVLAAEDAAEELNAAENGEEAPPGVALDEDEDEEPAARAVIEEDEDEEPATRAATAARERAAAAPARPPRGARGSRKK